jgi:hypothetical protein
MSYPPVSILNTVPYSALGTVRYLGWFCTDDNYQVGPFPASWTGPDRGVCLITEVSAVVNTPGGPVQAKPYSSSGTSFSQFAIIQTGGNSFEVTRRTSGAEDAPPPDYVEPTTQQK